jgi:hypothetical protein
MPGSNGVEWIFSNNSLKPKEIAQKNDITGYKGYRILGIDVLIHHLIKGSNASSDQVYFNVYNMDASKKRPNQLIGSSDKINVSDLKASGQAVEHNIFEFSKSVSVPEIFYVSFVLPTKAGDTVGIVGSKYQCNQVKDSTLWFKISDVFVPERAILKLQGGGVVKSEVPFYTIITNNVASIQENLIEEVTYVKSFPNPASDNTKIGYRLKENSDVKLVINDFTGKKVLEMFNKNTSKGIHCFDVYLIDFKQGIYFYTLEAANQRITNKLIINK